MEPFPSSWYVLIVMHEQTGKYQMQQNCPNSDPALARDKVGAVLLHFHPSQCAHTKQIECSCCFLKWLQIYVSMPCHTGDQPAVCMPQSVMGSLCVGHTTDQGGDREQSSRLEREQKEQQIRQRKGISVALGDGAELTCSMPAKKINQYCPIRRPSVKARPLGLVSG